MSERMGHEPPPHKRGRIWKGLLILLALHLLPLAFPPLYFGIGIVQIVYGVPAAILLRKEPSTAQGILIGMGITFLLNAACFGIVMGGGLWLG